METKGMPSRHSISVPKCVKNLKTITSWENRKNCHGLKRLVALRALCLVTQIFQFRLVLLRAPPPSSDSLFHSLLLFTIIIIFFFSINLSRRSTSLFHPSNFYHPRPLFHMSSLLILSQNLCLFLNLMRVRLANRKSKLIGSSCI